MFQSILDRSGQFNQTLFLFLSNQPLFGLLTDGTVWHLLKLENGSFQLTRPYLLAPLDGYPFFRNYDPESMERWMENEEHIALVKVIYQLLQDALAPIYEKTLPPSDLLSDSAPPAKLAKMDLK